MEKVKFNGINKKKERIIIAKEGCTQQQKEKSSGEKRIFKIDANVPNARNTDNKN
jgi:hypothetical protein